MSGLGKVPACPCSRVTICCWIRTLEAALAFEKDHPQLVKPPEFSL